MWLMEACEMALYIRVLCFLLLLTHWPNKIMKLRNRANRIQIDIKREKAPTIMDEIFDNAEDQSIKSEVGTFIGNKLNDTMFDIKQSLVTERSSENIQNQTNLIVASNTKETNIQVKQEITAKPEELLLHGTPGIAIM